MTKKKYDIAEWIPAREAAYILTSKLGRRIRADAMHAIASRLQIPVHRIDTRHWLYLKEAVEKLTENDFNKKKEGPNK